MRVLDEIERNRNKMIDFLVNLIKYPSLIGNEYPIQKFIANKLKEIDLKVELWEPDVNLLLKHEAFIPYEEIINLKYKNRPNVVGILKGKGRGKSIILNGHIDVVTPEPINEWLLDPYLGDIKNGMVIGRGAVDMKSGLAAMIFALESIHNIGISLKGDVIFQSVIDEEYDGAGSLSCILKGYKADGVLIAEPSNLNIFIAHAGVARFNILVNGKSVHPSRKSKGVSSIDKAIKIYRYLKCLDKERKSLVENKLFNKNIYPDITGVLVSSINAGSWRSTVPANTKMHCRIGFLPEESIEKVKSEVEKTLEKASINDIWLRKNPPKFEMVGFVEPASLEINEPIINIMKLSYKELFKKEAEIKGAPAGSDMRLFINYAKIPTIWFGPGSLEKAHSANEAVSIDEYINATKVIALFLLNWCGY
jgi:acetylornithine deacetylase